MTDSCQLVLVEYNYYLVFGGAEMDLVLGTLKQVDLREAWKNEAYDFTPWVSENMDLLGKALGIDLELVATEKSVGGYSLDILAIDTSTGDYVAIENQLEQTDHSHLGQLITYASGVGATAAIWISANVRDEHRQAVEWLNESTNSNLAFFAVQVELLQIDNSAPAPNFKVIASPNDWTKNEISNVDKSDKQKLYHQFFTDVLNMVKAEMPGITNATKVGYDNWFNYKAGKTGIMYGLAFKAGNKFGCELYIATDSKEKNEEIFDIMFAQKAEIEAVLGPLSWERLDHRKASRIAALTDVTSYEEGLLIELKKWAVENLNKFRNVFGDKLKAI